MRLTRKVRFWLGAPLLIVVSIAVVWGWRASHEPRWQGKTIDALFADFRKARALHRTVTNSPVLIGLDVLIRKEDLDGLFKDPACDGLRALGPYAVNWLGHQVETGDGFLARAYRSLSSHFPKAVRARLPTLQSRLPIQDDAAMALAAIGTNSAPAVPCVVRALCSDAGYSNIRFLAALRRLPLAEGDLDPALRHWSKKNVDVAMLYIDQLQVKTSLAACIVTNGLLSTNNMISFNAWNGVRRFENHAEIFVPALTRILVQGDQRSRFQARLSLAGFPRGKDLAIPAVLSGVRNGPAAARVDCILALRDLQISTNQAESLLADLANSRQSFLALTLIKELNMRTQLAIAVATNSLRSTNQSERDLAIAAVCRMSASAEMVLPALIDMLEDPDPALRAQSVHILHMFGDRAVPALPALIKTLGDSDENYRYDVIAAIESMGAPAYVVRTELEAATHDESAMVRNRAKRVLQTLGKDDAR